MSAFALRAGLALVAAALVALAVSAGSEAQAARCADVHIGPATWRAAHRGSLLSRSPTSAEQLASDLVRCRRLTGMTRAGVRHLLGRPDQLDSGAWLYQLALDRGILSAPPYLRLAFGRGGSVTGADIFPPG